jgi:hypothetical protein
MTLQNLPYKIQRGLECYRRFYLQNETPVLVYCTGRVGSIAMFNALCANGVFAFKVEDLDPGTGRSQRGTTGWVYNHITKPRRPAKVIFIVRNPVALMVSDFLPKLKWIVDQPDAHLYLSTEALVRVFNDQYFAQGRHTEKLNWFEENAQRFTGIDVYAHSFDREAGYGQFNNGTYDVLTVRTELDDATKAVVVGEFVGVPGLEIPRINVGETNQYGDVYKAFKEVLTIDADKLALIHNSRWGQHFYGTGLLEQMNAKWMPAPT